MRQKLTASRLADAALLLFFISCLLPSVRLSAGGEAIRGWAAAYYSYTMAVHFQSAAILLGCAANSLFLATYLAFFVRRVGGLRRVPPAWLAGGALVGFGSAVASAAMLFPATKQPGPVVWAAAPMVLAAACQRLAKEVRGRDEVRGFEVMPATTLPRPVEPLADEMGR